MKLRDGREVSITEPDYSRVRYDIDLLLYVALMWDASNAAQPMTYFEAMFRDRAWDEDVRAVLEGYRYERDFGYDRDKSMPDTGIFASKENGHEPD